jgi:small subunit ribosomal protein S13
VVWVALTRIYGIGEATGQSICDQLTISRRLKLKELSESKIVEMSQLLNSMKIEAELKRDVRDNIKKLIEMKCYRGLRHQSGFPVRGQKTQYNAQTAKKLNSTMLRRGFHT